MKGLEDYINEELILESIIGYLDNYKITLDLIPHAEDRQTRDDRPYIPKYEISWTIAKVAKNIRDDFNEELINYKDRIQIIDKSRNEHLNVLCDIYDDIKKSDNIKLSIVTIKEGNMPTHDIKKIYTTYSSDNKVKNEVSLLKKSIMTNSEFIKIINKLFKEINVTYKVLQYKKTDNKKFYPGYIYIDNMEQLTDEQNQFINDYIYPIFMDNDWEIFFYIGNNIDDFVKEYFPIIEEIETD